ncbi:MAG: DDE-type integrase/transposase/recombinase [Acidobacteria bacterium]|nr:DDE-type integrase/transposase/recombinase [Acidobacteriota bacterium]
MADAAGSVCGGVAHRRGAPARYPEQVHAGQARTLQCRFRDWRAQHGVEPEVFFQQVAVPGREAAIDFTHGDDLGVTIAGDPFPHLLFEFVLSFSHWTWVAVVFGETFEALVGSVQGVLWALGGVPGILRSDNLSAGTHELKASSGRDLTPRFRAVLEHYGMARHHPDARNPRSWGGIQTN